MARARRANDASIALADRLRAMHARGVSQREIARRTGLSRLFVHDVIEGTRRISAERAAVAAQRLAVEADKLPVSLNGQERYVEPLTARDRNKIKRWKSAVGRAMRRGDYDEVARKLKPSELRINTTEGPAVLDSDPERLRHLDDAGVLRDILLGESV